MQRAAGIFVGGIILGAVIAFAVMRVTPAQPNLVGSAPATASDDSRKSNSSSYTPSAERNKVILGNIATVPFQELYGVLSNRSAQEMAELARQLNDLPPGRETKNKINAFFTAWAHLDAKAALTSAIALKTSEAKGLAITAVIRGADAIAASALAATLNQLPADALPASQKARFLNSAVSKWSEVDPVAAAKFIDENPPHDREFFGARMTIAQNWAATDPTAALAWVQAQGDAHETRMTMSGVIRGWWENDPRAAEAYVAAHLDTLGIETVMTITSELYRLDPEQAKNWANSLPVEAQRNADGFIASLMVNADPKAASEWAASLPDEVRRSALTSVISKWARNDPQATGQWINDRSGVVRDEALSAYSFTMGLRDPAAALTLAATVVDPKIQSATVDRIVGGWMRRSPNDATAWIQNSAFSDSEKTRLLALPQGR
ncbi:MAG: hypothetical protein ACJ8NS_12750 [Chthoniobacterales bacterium]